MAKFKKIVAAALAAVTMATAMLGASATNRFSFATTGTTYGSNASENYIHYKELDYGSANVVTYSKLDSGAMEGNVVLSVGFAEDPTARRPKIASEISDKVLDYMASLQLRDSYGNYIFKGKYPLIVTQGSRKQKNVILSTNRIFMDSFRLDTATSHHFATMPKTDRLSIFYYIDNHHVLPSYDVVIKQRLSNGTYGATFKNEPSYTLFNQIGTRTVTAGAVYFDIPVAYKNSTFDVFINGIWVTTVKHNPKTYSFSF